MTKNFPNMKKEKGFQIQETQRVPNKIKLNRRKPRHIIIKISKC